MSRDQQCSHKQHLMHAAGPSLVKPMPHVESAGSGGKVKKRLLYLVQIVDRNVGKIMPKRKQGIQREVLFYEDLSGMGVTFRSPF